MTYAIGDQVEGYVLTEQGWVARLDLDPSPYRPGHVVNDAILTGALEWRPLRVEPPAPYQVGDVVEGYVLVPSGDWLPLAGQLRDRSGAPQGVATVAPAPQPQRTAKVRTTQKQTQAQARPATQRPRRETSGPQSQPMSSPARAQYRVGQVVDGNVLTADRGWVPLSQVQPRLAPRPAPTGPATKRSSGISQVLVIALAVILFSLLRSCA